MIHHLTLIFVIHSDGGNNFQSYVCDPNNIIAIILLNEFKPHYYYYVALAHA